MSAELAPPARKIASPLAVLGAIAHLAVLGVVGFVVFSILITLLSTGIGMLFAFGLGIIVLIGLAYALFGWSWVEWNRVEGLYHFGLAPLRARVRTRPGFGGVMLLFWHQLIDARMWRGIASSAIATLLGLVVISAVTAVTSGIVVLFAPLFASGDAVQLAGVGIPLSAAVPVGILAVVIGTAVVIGLALAHGGISRAILTPSRGAQLEQEARVSQVRRVGAVRAAEVERTRIERDLHDGVQPRLVSVGMTLGLAQQKVDDDPAAAKALIAEAHTSTKAAITELRQLARGIHTSILDDRGLDAALSALAGRSHIPVVLDVRATDRCSREAESALYFVIAEALTNAAKHSRATECRVIVRQREGNVLWARVEDNGLGGAWSVPGGGIDGISNRVLGAGGTLRLDSPAGGPTTLEASVPCAS